MTSDEYLESIISKYAVQTGVNSPAYKAANQFSSIIEDWAGNQINAIQVSGSYAKGTGVKGSTDIDIFVSLKSDTQGTLEEIYNKLYLRLYEKALSPKKQNVSIGLVYAGVSIDVVPGKKQSGNTLDHSLFKNKTGTWTQTNIQKHIDLISKSGRVNEIKLMKIWRNLNKLEFPSFYLELTVLEALYRKQTNQLSSNVWEVIRYIRDNVINARVIDPANSNNIISEDLTEYEKSLIQSAAQTTLTKRTWGEILW